MGLTIEIVDAARAHPASGWDEFVVKQDLPAYWQGAPIHAYATCAIEPVLLARAELDGETIALASFRGLRAPVRRLVFRDLSVPPRPLVLRCAVPVSFGPGLAFAVGVGPDLRVRALEELTTAVHRRSAPWCRGIVYESIAGSDRDLFSHCPVILRQSPLAVLHVRWPDLDAYLASLPPTRRRRFGALMARLAADPSVEAFDCCDWVDPVQATRLELATRLRHLPRRAGAAPLPLGYLDALAATDRASFFGFQRPSGTLLQFDLVLRAADRLVTTATGAQDRALASDLYSALFLREIAYAAAHGIAAIEFGPGALVEKLRFGCALQERYAFIAL